MAELRTRRNDGDVRAFLAVVQPEGRREDAHALLALMREVTGVEPAMWGDSIVGFGSYDYRYASGRTGTWFRVGFSPRKQNLTLYLMDGFDGRDELLGRLGRHELGRSCLHLGRLSGVDEAALRELVAASWGAEPMGADASA